MTNLNLLVRTPTRGQGTDKGTNKAWVDNNFKVQVSEDNNISSYILLIYRSDQTSGLSMVVVPADPTNIEPPTQVKISQSVIGTETTAGADATGINRVEIQNGVPGGIGVAETQPETTIFSIDAIETYPEFPGGKEAFVKFLRRHLRYPGMAAETGIQGRVILGFVIERNGDLSNIKVVRGIGSGCDEEAIRVLSKSPQWKPGIQNKQNVRVAYTLPINFSISN